MNTLPNRLRPPRLTLGQIDFGEDDANIEYEISSRANASPIFIRAFFDHPLISQDEIRSGRRFFVYGQKGTGKTAILRKIDSEIRADGGKTHFFIFRDEVASKEELDRLGAVFSIPVNDVKGVYHHLYTLERMILLAILSFYEAGAAAVSDEDEQSEPGLRSTVSRVIGQPIRRIVDTALRTAQDIAKVVDVDVGKITKDRINIDASTLLRQSNERLFEACAKALTLSKHRTCIFFDEIHFIYRVGADHDQDASLVRDLVRAVERVNRHLSQRKLNCTIYASIRSEYLSHPLISQGDLQHVLSGYGTEISWATFGAGFNHPMFEVGARRVEAMTHSRLTGRGFMRACFANFEAGDAEEFVQSTWSKPRDMIRFLRSAREMFPAKISLSKIEYRQAFHRACLAARQEVDTALTSFLTVKGIEKLHIILAKHASASLENGSACDYATFIKELQPIVKSEMQKGSLNAPETLFNLLYVLGVIYTSRSSKSERPILHSFHRGNPNPDLAGRVAIHRGVAKAFS